MLAAQILCVAGVAQAQGTPLNEPILPVPQAHKEDAKKAALGKKLFNDTRLSHGNTVSCASCHNLPVGGSDAIALSKGVQGRVGKVNSPTVLNSGLNFRQFWDGRAASLEEQVSGPIHDINEMDTSWAEVLRKLGQDSALTSEFKQSYPDGITANNVANALASFQRTLITPNARFDKYLRGDKSALTTDELRGYQLFKSYGCVACHQGVNVGGNMFQTFGVMGDYFGKRGNPTIADLGRYNVTKKDSDKYSFKVPSLRNVALTAPYFHDGSAKTLGDAVDVMFQFQLGRQASAEDKKLIVQFLHTLSGELDGKPLKSLQAAQ
ncbi:c-type cytochrome [Diaphorobacter aerolatus]|uniref:C-type cytochrome n=2 Tax=Diaphorobacter aerolatus TaxID=1288495 RepID=A0A7H0GJI9_9BURK|nr:c-type cytochrome [Diaphorobacter aerolatus]